MKPNRSRGPRWWDRPGLTPRQEAVFRRATTALIAVFVVGWAYAVTQAIASGTPPPLAGMATLNPLSRDAPAPAAFALDALMRTLVDPRAYTGASGAVRVVIPELGDSIDLPDSLPPGVELGLQEAGADTGMVPVGDVGVPARPGVWNVVVRMGNAVRELGGLSVISLVPLSERREGRIGRYRIGTWPTEGGRAREGYEPPRGLVRVTPQNRNVLVSEHFRLGDFLTKGQEDVWPKYVALSPLLLDKLELTIQELERRGHPVEHVGIISGFRTPNYNESGGDPSGRGSLSRHMYGDAMDWYVDNDRNGAMDDLNDDGDIDVGDARVIADAAEAVERAHPNLIGGIGIYRPNPGAHAGFVHLDTRGYRARW